MVDFVTDGATSETTQYSCATNPWQNSVWFWQVFGRFSKTGRSREAQHQVKWAPSRRSLHAAPMTALQNIIVETFGAMSLSLKANRISDNFITTLFAGTWSSTTAAA